mmetsp:Transcript_42445/g.165705  ORF Transcript_42445/g.165705 Transcript_42445/m.165705 type:complete len:87 (-) Transcript_42445:2556-2816(-)
MRLHTIAITGKQSTFRNSREPECDLLAGGRDGHFYGHVNFSTCILNLWMNLGQIVSPLIRNGPKESWHQALARRTFYVDNDFQGLE